MRYELTDLEWAAIRSKAPRLPLLTTTENDPTGKSVASRLWRVQPLSKKYFCFSEPQISANSFPVPPEEGRIASRHERAVGCDGRDSVGRARDRRAGFPVSDRPARGRTTLPTVFDETGRIVRGPARPLARRARTAKSCGPGAPMLASSLAEMHPAQPGFEMYRQSARRR